MDIEAHIKKIIDSNGDVNDWLDLIRELKNKHANQSLLLKVHNVALSNLKKESVGYKKLLIGLGNLQSEVSFQLANETFLDAKILDPFCSIAQVSYAQLHYANQDKNKARQIIVAAKKSGCTPKYIIRKAYHNWKGNKMSLFDGIEDPWDISLFDMTGETQSQTDTLPDQQSQQKDNQDCNEGQQQKPILVQYNSNFRPVRSVQKTKQTMTRNSCNTPKVSKKFVDPNTLPARLFSNNGIVDKAAESCKCSLGMSPIVDDYSPLVKRDFHFDASDSGVFANLFSNKKCGFVTPIRNIVGSRSSSDISIQTNENVLGSGSLNTHNDAKYSGMLSRRGKLRKHISSPCILQYSSDPPSDTVAQNNELPNISDTSQLGESPVFIINKDTPVAMNNESINHMTDQQKLGCAGNVNLHVETNDRKSTHVNLHENDLFPDIRSADDKDSSDGLVKDKENFKEKVENEESLEVNKVNNTNKENINPIKEIIEPYKEIVQPYKEIIQPYMESDKSVNTKLERESPDGDKNRNLINIKLEKESPDGDEYKNDVIPSSNEEGRELITCQVDDGLAMLEQHGFHLSQAKHEKEVVQCVKGKYYKEIKVLGKGGSCKVYEVLSLLGESLALKKVALQNIDEITFTMYTNEIKWLEKMQGDKYIIRLYDWEIIGDNLFIVLEKGECDLAHILRNIKVLSYEKMKEFWRQMLIAVNTIHENGIVHADLKPANFLLVGKILKLIDFGIANGIQDHRTSVTRDAQMGTLNYMSPEALKDQNDTCRISRASDVWSLGCILYSMIYNKTPYSHIRNQYSKILAILEGKPIVYKRLEDPLLMNCLQGCLKHNKNDRYTIQQLLAHPYLSS